VLSGGRGHDRLRGRPGSDALLDASGRDRLLGGDGRDRLHARDRHPYDLVAGGAGVDLCIADAGDRRSGCHHPLVASHDRPVPVLMYHVIGDPPPGTPSTDLWVSASTFAEQMRYLDRHGWTVVNLQDVYDYWHGGPCRGRRSSSRSTTAFDSHLRRGAADSRPARVVGDAQPRPQPLRSRPEPSGDPRASGRQLGVRLALAHARLPAGAEREARLRAEVSRSRRILRRLFHVPVNFFCYPTGAYNARVVAAVRSAGYQAASTTEHGLAFRSERYTMDRIRISRGDGVAGLARKLRGA
jgi:hypothetical protein